MKTQVIFGDEKLKAAFNKLQASKTEEQALYKWLRRAIEDLEKNAFCGIQVPKRLIPKEYHRKFGHLDNLWKYNLPNAWRLLYTVQNSDVVVLSIILEWMTHKEYDRKFGY